MNFTEESLALQLDKVLEHYRDLAVVKESHYMVQLHGSIPVDILACGFHLCQSYLIDICIPLNSDRLPYVIDTGHSVPVTYRHIYNDGVLCLDTDTRIRIRFLDGFDLIQWLQDFVEPYFFSYEYYVRYGRFPFGEREHGCQGLLQTYQELFDTSNIKAAYELMQYCDLHPYRGHHICPCGSGKRLRNCHGNVISDFIADSRKLEILRKDLLVVKKELIS